MKRTILIGIFFLIFTSFMLLNAQWARYYGGISLDVPYDIQQTSDGGYIAAGITYSFGAGALDIWVTKLLPNGDIKWQRTYGGSLMDEAYSIQQTRDGGYIVAGYTSSFGAGGEDVWILKLSANGDIEWQRTYGSNEGERAGYIQQTSDGRYIVVGTGSKGFWILKLYTNGDIEWQRTYGSNSWDKAEYIEQTRDGGYIVTGFASFSFGAGGEDVWILKLSVNGDIEWQRVYGGYDWDWAKSIRQTRDGGYIVAGYTSSFGAAGRDVWILKLYTNGDIEWQRVYVGSRTDYASSIQQTSDDGYVVAGSTDSFSVSSDYYNPWILKLSSNGDIEWQRTYGVATYDYAHSVHQTRDGGYIAACDMGYFYVLKLASNGDIDPSCGFIRSSNANVMDTDITPIDTYAYPMDTYITPQDTNISPLDTDAREYLLCQAAIPDPVISSLSPDSGPVGTDITISGSNFGTTPGIVTFNGVEAPITSWTEIEIITTVPTGATTGPVVVHASDSRDSNGVMFTVIIPTQMPFITELFPGSGPVGKKINIFGINFGTTQGKVTFNGISASISSWSNGQISTSVPSGATTGPVVVITLDNKYSNGVIFNISSDKTLLKSYPFAFSSRRDGNQEIYLMSSDGSIQINISNMAWSEDGYPRWSPSGQELAFATNRDGNWEVYVMNRNGLGLRNLSRNPADDGYMDWSPDGKSLVFASDRDGNMELYIIQSDGSRLTRLTNNQAVDVHPSWSPDGRRIAFASERDGNQEIYVINADGSNLVRLTNNNSYDDYPAWSPNGRKIVFASDRDSNDSTKLDIYVMNTKLMITSRLTLHPADDRHPTWSPSGRKIVFASDRDGNREIYVMNSDGTNKHRLTNDEGDDEHPVLSRPRRD